jgi:hypothetical protein
VEPRTWLNSELEGWLLACKPVPPDNDLIYNQADRDTPICDAIGRTNSISPVDE